MTYAIAATAHAFDKIEILKIGLLIQDVGTSVLLFPTGDPTRSVQNHAVTKCRDTMVKPTE
jgi:hypothetical protein